MALLAIQAHFKDKPTNFSGTTLIIALILEISIKISIDYMIARSLLSFHDGGRGCMCSNHNSALLLTYKKDLQSKNSDIKMLCFTPFVSLRMHMVA